MYLHMPGVGHGDLLHYSCLENPVDKGSWRALVHSVAKSWTCHIYTCVYMYIYIYTYIHTHLIFFIHSSVHRLLSCFHVLAVVSSATINTGVHVSF